MEQKINIAELLKDCPTGMELDCTMYDNCSFDGLEEYLYPIKVQTPDGRISPNKYGCYSSNKQAKCIIFPKGKTTWEGFVPPCKFKDGDVVVCTNEICTFTAIFKSMRDGSSFYRYGVMYDNKFRCLVNDWSDFNDSCRLATEEEKTKLFDAIKANGYKWNAETKTLEKLAEPSEGTLVQIDFTRELRIADEVEVILGEYEFVLKDGKTYFVKKKPQYPKTYEECCEVLMGKTDFQDFELVLTKISINRYEGNSISPEPPHISLINSLYKLLICRDAYWKIAGEQMGLNKPWKPDWNNVSDKHCIYFISGEIWSTECQTRQCTLVFPTAEMRDAFYDNFKELIDKCKELL